MSNRLMKEAAVGLVSCAELSTSCHWARPAAVHKGMRSRCTVTFSQGG